MTLRLHPTSEKLSLIEDMIEFERRNEDRPEARARRISILRAVAADLRVRLEGRPTIALHGLEEMLGRVSRSRTRLGYDNGAMIALAERFINHWPAVKTSLELQEAAANAPDAVQALEAVRKSATWHDLTDDLRATIQAAIAKCKGDTGGKEESGPEAEASAD